MAKEDIRTKVQERSVQKGHLEALEKAEKVVPAMERPWKEALRKSREPFLGRLQGAWDQLRGQEVWGEEHPMWEALEEALLGSDVGPRICAELLDSLREEFSGKTFLRSASKETSRVYVYGL